MRSHALLVVRRGWDSNPRRRGNRLTAFRVPRTRPDYATPPGPEWYRANVPPMRAKIRMVSAVLALTLAVAACGGGDGDDGGADGAGIEVAGLDFEFRPDTYRVAAGTEVEVTFENAGTLEHNWLILATPIRGEDELVEENVLFKIESAAGETARATFRPPPPGEYQVICDIPGHLSAGMEGTLTVTP